MNSNERETKLCLITKGAEAHVNPVASLRSAPADAGPLPYLIDSPIAWRRRRRHSGHCQATCCFFGRFGHANLTTFPHMIKINKITAIIAKLIGHLKSNPFCTITHCMYLRLAAKTNRLRAAP